MMPDHEHTPSRSWEAENKAGSPAAGSVEQRAGTAIMGLRPEHNPGVPDRE